ncbi:cell division protein FtsA [Pontibacter sp. G13]|uniref:cell division protein FtsA n=1 Tax=Pontibacter sp. G13 TaxID=3074898 RepID=UPI00288B3AB4|nr:cell division protein FtsA [Pontibacter sp. G13]WNJ20251.1 cell division protein FtsA [Pontibacter sp. G13]
MSTTKPISSEEIVVGLDIGTTKICAIVGKRNEYGKINILGLGKAGSDGVSRGVVVNIEKTVQAIREAISEAEKHSGIKIEVVHVGIAGEHVRSMQHKGIITLNSADFEISQEDVNRLHEDMFKIATKPGHEIIHVLPQEYTVDNQSGIIDPVGMSGVRLEGNFHIVTGQTTAANNIYRCVVRAGLEVAELILEPLASSAAVLTEEEKEAGVCLVDIGGGTTDIAIFENNIIRHTAVIPFGGNIVTEDIKHGCKVMKKHAELLKIQYGSALADAVMEDVIISIPGPRDRPAKEIHKVMLAQIIQSRMEEIMEFVLAEIKNSGYEDKLVAGIVVTGGGSQLQHMKQCVEYVTGIDTRIGLPGEHLASGLVDEVNFPMFATGAGLVVMGLEATELTPVRTTTESGERQLMMQTPKGASRTGPRISFIDKVKTWFESTLTNTGDFIE